jgi:hypothetical protein
MTARHGADEHRREVTATGIDTEHLVAMGEVAVWAARVERTLAMVVTALISTEAATGATVTNGMGYSTLSDLGKRLVDQRPENDQPRAMYLNLLPRMKEAMAHRNHLLHGEWNQLDEGPASVTLTRMGGSKERTYSVEQVEQVAYELASVAKRLFLLVLIIDDVLEYDWFPSSNGAGDTW